MIVLELFCGTKSIANAFEARGHKVFTVDWDKSFDPTLCVDIGALTAQDVINLCGGVPDVIWASFDCTSYSIAAISHHRIKEPRGNLAPKSDYAKKCDEVNKHVLNLSEGRSSPNGLYAKISPLHDYLLSVRRYKNETHGYMDKSPKTELQANVQKRRPLPRSRSERIENRNSRIERGKGTIKNTRVALRTHR